jgi:calretinin
LDNLLRELAECYAPSDSQGGFNESTILELKKAFLEAYDDDSNGKITLEELAEILPTDQNFLLLFRHKNQTVSTSEFMKVNLLKCSYIIKRRYLSFQCFRQR